jgi:hypothetical protein
VPFVVRYPFDTLRAVSPSTLLGTLGFSKGLVEELTTNGKANSYIVKYPFTLRFTRLWRVRPPSARPVATRAGASKGERKGDKGF